MSCESCVKINPLPACIAQYTDFLITNISFPNNVGDDILAKLTDLATGRVSYTLFEEGTELDLSSEFPFMDHFFKLEFSVNGVPAIFTITNPDATQVEGCCIEFTVQPHLVWTASAYEVSTTNCIVT